MGSRRGATLPCASSIVPHENINLSLKRPRIRTLHQPLTHGIGANILPFAGIALAVAQLRVPAIPLPKRQGVRTRKAIRHHAFPTRHPNMEIGRRIFRRRTEKVDVVGHDHVASHDPAPGPPPHVQKERLHIAVGQYALPLVRNHRGEKDNRPVITRRENRIARRVFSHGRDARLGRNGRDAPRRVRIRIRARAALGRDGARPSQIVSLN